MEKGFSKDTWGAKKRGIPTCPRRYEGSAAMLGSLALQRIPTVWKESWDLMFPDKIRAGLLDVWAPQLLLHLSRSDAAPVSQPPLGYRLYGS